MMGFRMMAVGANFGALSAAPRLSYLAFRSAFKRTATDVMVWTTST